MCDSDSQKRLAQLKEEIDGSIHHALLGVSIEFPVVDEEKLMMQYQMFQESHCPPTQVHTRIVAVMCVQAALDIHGAVPAISHPDSHDPKQRQLSVLAGDYYSGLYYHLLAKAGDLAFIRAISGAIGETNEHKMRLHHNSASHVDDVIESLSVDSSALLQRVAQYLGLPTWRSFFREYFLLRRLLTDKQTYLQSGASLLYRILVENKGKSNVFFAYHEQPQSFLPILDTYISGTIKELNKLIARSPQFKTLMNDKILASFFDQGGQTQKLAEEG